MDNRKEHKLPASVRVKYFPLRILLDVIGRMPLRLSRFLADLTAFLAADVIRYRRRIIRRNIADSFPDMDERQVRRTARRFYRHLADYFVETLHFPYMSSKELEKRIRFENPEVLDRLMEEGKSVLFYTAHYGNWEWLTCFSLFTRHPEAVYAHVYRPLTNRWFDDLFLRIRTRFNESIPMSRVFHRLARLRAEGRPVAIGFLSDQKPDLGSQQIEVPFMKRSTPFIEGTEILARRLGMAVCYFDMTPVERGRYSVRIVEIARDPSELPEGEITRRYAELLEASIRRSPAQYLWSHNKWRLPRK